MPLEVWKTPIVAEVPQIVEDLRQASGMMPRLRDIGTDVMVSCPFHANGQERKPSMGISKGEVRRGDKVHEAGIVHCYACGYAADLPKFVADLLGLRNAMDGFKWLVNRYTYGAGESRAEIELNLDRERQGRTVLSGEAVEGYHQNLLSDTRAFNYLYGRKIAPRLYDEYLLGYNPERDSITIPIRDKNGNFVMIKERSIEGKRFYNTHDAEKTAYLFGLYEAIQRDPMGERMLWVTESEIDALTAVGWGVNAIAIMGSHIADRQCDELCKTRFRSLCLALDNDKAGAEGCRRMKDRLIPKGFRLFNLRWNTDKKDLNELTADEFGKLERY